MFIVMTSWYEVDNAGPPPDLMAEWATHEQLGEQYRSIHGHALWEPAEPGADCYAARSICWRR